MKNLRCLLGRHKFSEWIEVENHIERECLRCPKVEAKYPDPIVMLANIASDLIWKYYMSKTTKPPFPGRYIAFKRRDDRQMFGRFNRWISGSFDCIKCGRRMHLMSFGYGDTICPRCYDGEKQIIFLDESYWLNRLISGFLTKSGVEKHE